MEPQTPIHSARDPYLLDSVLRVCDLLRAFRTEGETLRLKEIIERTGMNKTVAFRLTHTLVAGGLLERTGRGRYRSSIKFRGRRRFRMGYAAQAEDSPFSLAVSDSLYQAASKEEVELLIVNNRYSTKTALANAELLISERVDLAFEFQTFDNIAPLIASRFHDAGIPLVAIEIPHPGAVYYGVNNYQVGMTAGRALGRWAKANWNGEVEQVLLLELRAAGSVPQLRVTGLAAGIEETLPHVRREAFVRLDSKGDFSCALDLVRKHLRRVPPWRTLIGAINDPAVLGALRAFEEAGRLRECAAMGHGAIPEARAEMRRPNSRLIGSVAFFPERYGEMLMRLAIDILMKKHVPPAVYAEHRLVSPASVNCIYPESLDAGESRDLMMRPALH